MRPDNSFKKSGRNVVQVRDFRQTSSKRFEDISRPNNRWDKPPPGFEKISPLHVLAQPEVQPGIPLRGSLADKLRDRLSVAPLTVENARLNRCVIVTGEARDYTLGLFKSLALECRPRPTKLKDGRTLVELDSPKHAAILLAVPGPLRVERPPGLVTGLSESIWSSHDSCILPPDSPGGSPGSECIKDTTGKVLAYISRGTEGRPLYPERLEQGTIEPSTVLIVANAGYRDVKGMEELLLSMGATSTKRSGSVLPIVYARFEDIETCASTGLSIENEPFNGRQVFCAYGNEEAYDLEIFG